MGVPVCVNEEGSTLLVAQLVETLRYKPEGRGFDSGWCYPSSSLVSTFYQCIYGFIPV